MCCATHKHFVWHHWFIIYQPGKTNIVFTMPLPDDDVPIPSIIHVCPIPSFSSAASIVSLTVSSDDDSVNTAFVHCWHNRNNNNECSLIRSKSREFWFHHWASPLTVFHLIVMLALLSHLMGLLAPLSHFGHRHESRCHSCSVYE